MPVGNRSSVWKSKFLSNLRRMVSPAPLSNHRRIYHVTQSVTISPGTRANSRPFAVTRVAPRRRA